MTDGTPRPLGPVDLVASGPSDPPTEEDYSDAALFDLSPVEFPEDEEFDYRSQPSVETPNANILLLMDDYLGSAGAVDEVRHHIPNLLRILGAKLADRRNRFHPVHFYGPRIPFRYKVHGLNLGASGTHKDATVEQFFQVIGALPGEPPLFPTFSFKGGSVESMRGGVTQDRPSDPKLVKPGSIERTDDGFLHVPEFTQVAELGERFGGSVQTLLAWADTGCMSYETISGRAVDYLSGSTLLAGLQPALLSVVAAAAAGWARRVVYDHYTIPRTESLLPENRPVATDGDPLKLAAVRNAVLSLARRYAPKSVDWSPFHRWLSDAYRANLVVRQDEQVLYSIALGHHLVSGGSWTGDIQVAVTEDLNDIFRRLLWNKRLSRISTTRRLAREAFDVLEDPYVLGGGGPLLESEAVRIVSARISAPEEAVEEALVRLQEVGSVVREVETNPDGTNGAASLRLARR